MGKEALAKLLDENFKVEMPMVIGYKDKWVVMMEPDEGVDSRWVEAAKEHIDFELNVSSELSEERSCEESEVVLDPDEPVITIRIGYNLEEGLVEESIEFEDSESEVEEV